MVRTILACSMLLVSAAQISGAQQRPDSAAPVASTGEALRDSVPAVAGSAQWQRRERGFSVGTLDADSDGVRIAPTLSRALQARLPGVTVSQSEGILGATSHLWLRGPRSVTFNEPLLIIDGVRTHSSAMHRGFETRPLPSRLEDLDMETVERIDVLRGPAAAAIYGPGASKGVILVTTRRGSADSTRWTAFAESGPSIEVTRFPANFGTTGISTATGAPVDNCPLAQQAAGACTPVARRSWNPLESASPFRTGWTNSAGASAAGGASGVFWRVAASHDRADGVYETDQSRATNGSISVSASPFPGSDMRLTAAHRIDRLRHPLESPIAGGLFGASVDDPDSRGYSNGGYRYLTRAAENEDVSRTTVGLSSRWDPRSWLRTGFALGYDRLEIDTDYRIRQPQFTFPEPTVDSVTRTGRTSDRPEARSAALDATMSYDLRGFASRSTIGLQYLREDDWGTSAGATITDDPGGGSSSYESSSDARRSSTGVFLEQHLGWDNRLFITGAVRVDRPRLFDVKLRTMVSRSIDVSWTALDENSTTSPDWLGELRLRAAYGVGGDQLIVGQPFSFSGPTPAPARETTERGSEIEIGADALIGEHLRASLTWFDGTSSRGLIAYPSFQGAAMISAADVAASGLEATFDSRLLQLAGFSWDMRVLVSRRSSEIESMGLPAFVMNGQRWATGRPVGEYLAAPYSYADVDGDGLIAPDEVTVLSGEWGPVGSPHPEYEIGVGTTLSLGRGVQLSALLDHRSGMTLYDQVARQRCRTLCAEQHDPATPLGEQVRSVAAGRGAEISYFEDASYTKLREVRLSLAIPARVARLGGASGARVSLTGRNLATWTGFTGLDPEIAHWSTSSLPNVDRLLQPPVRTFTARLDLAW